MGYAWMPGASCLWASADGGPMRGGAPRAVWQALDTDPRLVSAKSAAQHLDKVGRPAHLVWNPLTGEIVQLIPALRAGCQLGSPVGASPAGTLDDRGATAGSAADTQGRVCVQIAVVAFSWEPFTDGPLQCLERIIDWLDSWQVPRRWPAGRPSPFEQAHAVPRSRRRWASGGHFAASQVPGCATIGPGAVDIERLTGATSPGAIGIPPPRADTGVQWATGQDIPAARLAGGRAPGATASTAPGNAATPASAPASAAASAAGSPAASAMR